MSHYTTELRYIVETSAGLDESTGYNDVNKIIDIAIPNIFNFDFPIFDEAYRKVLEKKIVKHFYTREIGFETVGLWKLKLDTKLNEIMPYYNKLYESELIEFNPLYTIEKSTTHSGTEDRDLTGNSATSGNSNNISQETSKNNSNTNTSAVDNTASASANTDLYSDTPQGQITHLEDKTYLTNARQVNDNGIVHNENNANTSALSQTDTSSADSNIYNNSTANTEKVKTLDNYIDRVIGRNYNPNKLLADFRKNILNIDMMIIRDLEDLFMQLW